MIYLCAVQIPEQSSDEEIICIGDAESGVEQPEAFFHFFIVVDVSVERAELAVQCYCEDHELELLDVAFTREISKDKLLPKIRKSIPDGKGLVNNLEMIVAVAKDNPENRNTAADLVFSAWTTG